MNRLSSSKRVQVVAALVEGASINAIVRMTGVAKHTINYTIGIGCVPACLQIVASQLSNLSVQKYLLEAYVSNQFA